MPIKANKQSNTHLGLGPKLPEWPYLIVVRVSLRISYNLQRVKFENQLELKILHTSLLSESKRRIHHLDEVHRKDGFPGITTSASSDHSNIEKWSQIYWNRQKIRFDNPLPISTFHITVSWCKILYCCKVQPYGTEYAMENFQYKIKVIWI